MPGATPRYTPEFRAEAVRLVRSSPDKSIVQIATELGISETYVVSAEGAWEGGCCLWRPFSKRQQEEGVIDSGTC
jgi:hypothetical protein